jgi:signal transduction histidine kinase
MKLINKISRYYLINSVIIFIVSFISIYITLNWILTDEIDEQLRIKNDELIKRFYSGESVNNPPFTELSLVDTLLKSSGIISDTIIYFTSENENEPFHQITSFISKDDKNYKLVVRSSLIEKEDLFISLLVIFSLTFGALVILLFFINRKSTKEIFTPFYSNLVHLKHFSVKSASSLKLTDSNILEFSELNSALHSLSEKAVTEYLALKEFSEDLSHELQTLVAVIKSKVELLLQKDNLDEASVNDLHVAYQNLGRLDGLNRSLILLAKLENKDFFDSEEIILESIINKVIENYRDVAEAKHIKINTNINSDLTILCNPVLIETLINNLISNSIKHNIANGTTDIKFSENVMEIQNTGESFTGNTEEFFNRFNKISKKSDSTGLGLAIVKKICDLYNFSIEYSIENQFHKVSITFS